MAAAQYPIVQHDHIDAWKKHVADWVASAIDQRAELLVFPEYGSMELVSLLNLKATEIKEQVIGLQSLLPTFLTHYEHLASYYHCIIVAPSFPVSEGGKVYNRAYVFGPNGLVDYQDKGIMTRFENEDWMIDAGEPNLKIFECAWGSFGIQICYDIEFPNATGLMAMEGAELILSPSCTETIRGANRVHIGARARAMEWQCYTAVAQTIGDAMWCDAVDINYGYAGFYSTPDLGFPVDGILSQGEHQKPQWLLQDLDFSLIDTVRSNGTVLNYEDSRRQSSNLTLPFKVSRVKLLG